MGSKLILFPIKASKPRKGDATEEDMKKASQLQGPLMPVKGIDNKRLRAMEVLRILKTSKPLTLSVNLEALHDYGVFAPRRLRKLKPMICQNPKNKLIVAICTLIHRNIHFIKD